MRLKQGCKKQGADEGAAILLCKISPVEVSSKALTHPLADTRVETEEFGTGTGRVYTSVLESTNEEVVAPRYICRLCHGGQTWKHAKDVLRLSRWDRFGLADTYKKRYVYYYSLANMYLPEIQRPKCLYKGRNDATHVDGRTLVPLKISFCYLSLSEANAVFIHDSGHNSHVGRTMLFLMDTLSHGHSSLVDAPSLGHSWLDGK